MRILSRKAGPWLLTAVLGVTIATAGLHYYSFIPIPSPLARIISPYEIGKAEASRDLQKGKQIIKTYGLPSDGRDVYKEILWNKYGVELKAVAGCLVSDDLTENVRGYNEVMEAYLEKRHGKNLLERVQEQARIEYEKESAASHGR